MRAPSLVLALVAASSASAYDAPYKPLGVFWDVADGPVPFTLHPAGSDDVPGEDDLAALRSAFRRWGCVEGSALRFLEAPADVAPEVDLDDGVNVLFWDETGAFGLGPATLGVTYGNEGDPAAPVVRTGADIVFNGVDATWSAGDPITGVDVESIAVHEIGHLLGLDHPCDGSAPNESSCNDGDRSVMTPAWAGGDARAPRPDDLEGLRALYASEPGDDSTCDGPFRRGEPCACDDECISGLRCVAGLDGDPVCASACSSQDTDCGGGFACVLSARIDGAAPGRCVKVPIGVDKPAASACASDGECADGVCLAASAVGRSICRVSCDETADCPSATACVDGACVAAAGALGIACAVEPAPACGAVAVGRGRAWAGAVVMLGALLAGARRRRRAP